MKLLSIIFFISSLLSVILSALAFLGKLPSRGKETGITLAVAAAVFGICELICIWNSPKGLILTLSGVFLINLILIISRDGGDGRKNE